MRRITLCFLLFPILVTVLAPTAGAGTGRR